MLNSLLAYFQDVKTAGVVAMTMLLTWLTNFWAWLGPNIGALTGLIGLIIGVVTLYVQTITVRIRLLELNKAKEKADLD